MEIGLVPWSTTACIDRADCYPAGRQLALPPKSDPQEIRQAIDDLVTTGATRSSAGVSVAKALLDRAPPDNRKALVLLTDGARQPLRHGAQRTRPGNCSPHLAAQQRDAACTAAKDDGIEIFVIAAMVPSLVSSALGQGLRACSSEGERPGDLRVHQQRDARGPGGGVLEHRASASDRSTCPLGGFPESAFIA